MRRASHSQGEEKDSRQKNIVLEVGRRWPVQETEKTSESGTQ